MNRKGFIQGTCKICLMGAVMYTFPMSKIWAKDKIKYLKAKLIDGQIKVPLSDLPDTGMVILDVSKLDFEIALVPKISRIPQGDTTQNKPGKDTLNHPTMLQSSPIFTALYLQCTHMENALDVNKDGFRCSMHGSQFDLTGAVTKGPAEKPLIQLNSTIVNDQYIINLSI